MESSLKVPQSEFLFNVLSEQSPNMIFINKKGKVVYGNRKCEEIMGYSRKELYAPKFDFLSLIAPEYRKNVVENFKKHMSGKEIPPTYYELITKKGKRIYARHDTKLIDYEGERAILGVITDLTNEQKAREKIEESEIRFRTLVNSSPDAITETDLEGKIVTASAQTAKLHGYKSPQELVGKSALDLIAPKDHARAERNLRKTLEEGRVTGLEYTLLRKDGTTFIGELSAGLIKDSAGNPKAFIASVRDVTEKREKEVAMEESEERHRIMVEQTGQLIYDYDVGTGKIVWSGAVREVTGFSKKGFQKVDIDGWAERIHLDDREQTLELLDEKQKTGGKFEAEYRFRKRNGSYVHILDRGVFLINEKGVPYRMLGTMTDISDRVIALQNLKKFQLAVENAAEQILITDPDAKILYANPTTEDTTGYSQKEIIGKTPALWGKQMPKKFYEKMWKTIKQDKKSFFGEVVNKRKNGQEYPAELRITPILDEKRDVKFFVGIERDVTHEKEISAMKSEFVSLASHQLRTPLTAISWYTEMLLGGDVGEVSGEQKGYLSEIYTSVRRMVRLVNDLLNVSRLESGRLAIEPEPTSLPDFIQNILDEVKSTVGDKRCQVVLTKSDKNLSKIPLDRKLIRQVFRNLITNAIQYSSPKRKCRVNIDIKPETIGEVESFVVSVEDNGIGIPKEEQKRIFERFFRSDNAVKQQTEGTGLGLYISKLVLEASGGKIWFKSKVGKGSTFYVAFPVKGMKEKKGEVKLSLLDF